MKQTKQVPPQGLCFVQTQSGGVQVIAALVL